RNLLMHGEYPTAVVRIELDPADVDVNVHPTKAQVKFKNPQDVFRAVSSTIRSALEKAPWLPEKTAEPTVTAFKPKAEGGTTLSFTAPEFRQTQYSQKMFPLAMVREAIADSPKVSSAATPNQPATEFRWQDLQIIG